MLKGNNEVVSNEVAKQDIDPILLLWDSKNQTWYAVFKQLTTSTIKTRTATTVKKRLNNTDQTKTKTRKTTTIVIPSTTFSGSLVLKSVV